MTPDIAAAWAALSQLHCQWKIDYDPAGWGTVTLYCWCGDEETGEFKDARATFDNADEAPAAIMRAIALAKEKP